MATLVTQPSTPLFPECLLHSETTALKLSRWQGLIGCREAGAVAVVLAMGLEAWASTLAFRMAALMTGGSPWQPQALSGAQRPWQARSPLHTCLEQEVWNVTVPRKQAGRKGHSGPQPHYSGAIVHPGREEDPGGWVCSPGYVEASRRLVLQTLSPPPSQSCHGPSRRTPGLMGLRRTMKRRKP